jgi:hypothetical protein
MKTAALAGAALILALPRALPAQEPSAINVSLSATAAAAGALEPGQESARQTLLVDQAKSLTLVVTSPVRFRTTLRLADGSTVSTQSPTDRAQVFELDLKGAPDILLPGMGRGHNVVITMKQPPPGRLDVRLDAPAAHRRVPFAMTLVQDSEVRLGLLLPQPQVRPGEAVVVAALAFEEDKPMKGVQVTASLVAVGDDPAAPAAATKVDLRDDGQGPDAEAGDGCYTGVLVPARAGLHFISVRARGQSGAGLPFARDVGAALEVKEK